MPLFTVTMKANRSAKEKDLLSRTIHAASVVAGYPEEDLWRRGGFAPPNIGHGKAQPKNRPSK